MTKSLSARGNGEQRGYCIQDVEDYLGQFYARARNDFATFRRMIHPEMLCGWWTEEVARELQRFSRDLTEGRRPILAIMAPPQHGKSWTVSDFTAWVVGKFPNYRIIFASYAAALGIAANTSLKRTIKDSRAYRHIFPGTQIDLPGWQCTSDFIEFAGHAGSFRNTTVKGPVNGHALNLGVIDDPIKSRAAASSKYLRDQTWSWFTDDFYNRFDQNAGLIIVMTCWHVDDLLGRLLVKFPGRVKVLRYPAIAEDDELHEYQGKPYLRRKGDALFEELKPRDFLLERKKLETQASWESLFQQNPLIQGGGDLPIDKLRVLKAFDRRTVIHSVRYWDKAATDDDENAAYTAGVLMHKFADGRYVIEHVARGRWNALDREQHIKALAASDSKCCKSYEIIIEQEPGSGGKESAEATIRNLAGFRVVADKVTGSKRVRAQPFAAQVQGGNVWLVADRWVQAFLDECETWPRGRYLDQVDAAVGAFNRLAKSPYSTNYSLWS